MAGATKSPEARTLTERPGCGEHMHVVILFSHNAHVDMVLRLPSNHNV